MDIFPGILSCFSLWKPSARFTGLALTPSGQSRYLPDEILLQILSKLPVKSVIICRCVCRRWKTLTLTPEFLDLHQRDRVPTIIVQQKGDAWYAKNQISIVDEWEATRRTTRTQKVNLNLVNPVPLSSYPQQFLYSCSGLLIFLEEFPSIAKLQHFILFNPITQQKVRLITPQGSIYGVFLDPLVKDQYCVLWGGKNLRIDGSMRYKLLFLGRSKSQSQTKPKRGTKTRCWKRLYDNDRPVSVQPRVQTPPVIVSDVLYWMVGCRYATSRLEGSSPGTRLGHYCPQSITTFNTRTKKFNVMAHPGPHDEWCKEDREHKRMHLVDMDDHGVLCLCECTMLEPLINIWVLKQEDAKRSSWIRRHTVNIAVYVRSSPFSTSVKNYFVRPVVFTEGELYVEWRERGLFALNLTMGTTKMFERRLWNKNTAVMYAHTPCLVPIRNCESEIWM